MYLGRNRQWVPLNQVTARKLLHRAATFFPSLSYFLGKKLTFKLQRTANEYAAKCRIDRRPEQQKYTLSRHTEFCKADRTTLKLTLQDINMTPKEPKTEHLPSGPAQGKGLWGAGPPSPLFEKEIKLN